MLIVKKYKKRTQFLKEYGIKTQNCRFWLFISQEANDSQHWWDTEVWQYWAETFNFQKFDFSSNRYNRLEYISTQI